MPGNKINDVILLDKNGDAVLEVEDPYSQEIVRFLISTKVLGLASSVFAKMFEPNFQDRRKISGDLISVRLENDDTLIMGVILKVLHYRGTNEIHPIHARKLASIALHGDKYGCIAALSPCISYWLSYIEPETKSSEDLGFLLLTTYKLNNSKRFMETSARAIKYLTLGCTSTWKSHETLSLLPEIVQGTLT